MKYALDEIGEIVALREFMGVSNLCKIPEITYNAAYRAQLKSNSRVDTYVLFAWQQMYKYMAKAVAVAPPVNINNSG